MIATTRRGGDRGGGQGNSAGRSGGSGSVVGNAWAKPLPRSRIGNSGGTGSTPVAPPPGIRVPSHAGMGATTSSSGSNSSSSSVSSKNSNGTSNNNSLNAANSAARRNALRERFLNLTLNLIDQEVVVTQKNGAVIEGKFHTFTPCASIDSKDRNMYVVKMCKSLRGPLGDDDSKINGDDQTNRPYAKIASEGCTVVIPAERVSNIHVKSIAIDSTPAHPSSASKLPGNKMASPWPNSSSSNGHANGDAGSAFRTDSDIASQSKNRSRELVAAGSAWTSGATHKSDSSSAADSALSSGNRRADALHSALEDGGTPSRRTYGPSTHLGGAADRGKHITGGALTGTIGKWDQFRANEQLFDVKASFNENLYTTELDKSRMDAKKIEEAERLAREIEGSAATNIHVAEERGQAVQGDYDEEDLYSGVLQNTAKALVNTTPKSRLAETVEENTNDATNEETETTEPVVPTSNTADIASPVKKTTEPPATSSQPAARSEQQQKAKLAPAPPRKMNYAAAAAVKVVPQGSSRSPTSPVSKKKPAASLPSASLSKRPVQSASPSLSSADAPETKEKEVGAEPDEDDNEASADVVDKEEKANEVMRIEKDSDNLKEALADDRKADAEDAVMLSKSPEASGSVTDGGKDDMADEKTKETTSEIEVSPQNSALEDAVGAKEEEKTEKVDTVASAEEEMAVEKKEENDEASRDAKKSESKPDAPTDTGATGDNKKTVTSKLNPSSKKFTFNPSAKAFTPKGGFGSVGAGTSGAVATTMASPPPPQSDHQQQPLMIDPTTGGAVPVMAAPGATPPAMHAQHYVPHPGAPMGQPGAMMPVPMHHPYMRYPAYNAMGQHAMPMQPPHVPQQPQPQQQGGAGVEGPGSPPPGGLVDETSQQQGGNAGNPLNPPTQQQQADMPPTSQAQGQPGGVPIPYGVPPNAGAPGYYPGGIPMHGQAPAHIRGYPQMPPQQIPVVPGGNPYRMYGPAPGHMQQQSAGSMPGMPPGQMRGPGYPGFPGTPGMQYPPSNYPTGMGHMSNGVEDDGQGYRGPQGRGSGGRGGGGDRGGGGRHGRRASRKNGRGGSARGFHHHGGHQGHQQSNGHHHQQHSASSDTSGHSDHSPGGNHLDGSLKQHDEISKGGGSD